MKNSMISDDQHYSSPIALLNPEDRSQTPMNRVFKQPGYRPLSDYFEEGEDFNDYCAINFKKS